MVSSIGALALGLALTACTPGHTRSTAPPAMGASGLAMGVEVARRHDWRLAAGSRVLFAYPEISKGHVRLPRTAEHMAQLIRQLAPLHFAGAEFLRAPAGFQDSLSAAETRGYDYLITLRADPPMDHQGPARPAGLWGTYEAAESDGVRPVSELEAWIYDVRSGKLLDTVRVKVSRGLLGGGGPDHSRATVDTLLKSLSGN